jgi:hypothetical protein
MSAGVHTDRSSMMENSKVDKILFELQGFDGLSIRGDIFHGQQHTGQVLFRHLNRLGIDPCRPYGARLCP